MQTYISVWRKEARAQTGQTTQAKADTRELGLLSILRQILQTLAQLVTVVVIVLVAFQMMVCRPYIRWPRFKIWTLWQQDTSALTRLGKQLLWKKMDRLHNWLHNDKWLRILCPFYVRLLFVSILILLQMYVTTKHPSTPSTSDCVC